MFAILKSMRCLIGSQWSCWRRVRGLQDWRERVTSTDWLKHSELISGYAAGVHNPAMRQHLQSTNICLFNDSVILFGNIYVQCCVATDPYLIDKVIRNNVFVYKWGACICKTELWHHDATVVAPARQHNAPPQNSIWLSILYLNTITEIQ